MRFLYLYLMRDTPERIQTVGPEHAAYWRDRRLPEYLGGPFADRSGGLITFEASSTTQAESLVSGDPFVREDLVADRWLKQWLVD